MNTKACLAALILSTGTIALAQNLAPNAPPPPPDTANDLAARMAARRAQQINEQNANVPPPQVVNPPAAVNAVNASTPPAAPPPAPATQPADPRWQALITRLSSEDFATREAAQKELDKVSWRNHDLLKQLADATADAEAKARLFDRVQKIEDQMVIEPPPISLELNNASIADVVDALEKATGTKFSDVNSRNFNNRNALFTLSAKEQSFWEIFRELNDQHPLSVQGYNGIRFYQQSPGMRPTQIIGGVAIFAQSITKSATVNLQANAGPQVQPPTLSFQYAVAVDPRMKFAKYQQPHLTEVRDDAGNTLLSEVLQNRNFGWSSGPQNYVWNSGESLAIPANLGKKITSAKGELKAVLQLASEVLDVPDPSKKLNVPITVAGQTAEITQFEVLGDQIRFNISRKNTQGNMQDAPAMSVAFIDSAGQQIWSSSLQGGTGGGVGGSNIKPPVKVQFTVATKTKEVTIPFEFKDLPLP